MVFANGCSAAVTFSYNPATTAGASACTSWKVKHSRLLPWAKVAPLKTPFVKSETSRPVKEFVVPVLPPIERRRGSSRPKARTSRT